MIDVINTSSMSRMGSLLCAINLKSTKQIFLLMESKMTDYGKEKQRANDSRRELIYHPLISPQLDSKQVHLIVTRSCNHAIIYHFAFFQSIPSSNECTVQSLKWWRQIQAWQEHNTNKPFVTESMTMIVHSKWTLINSKSINCLVLSDAGAAACCPLGLGLPFSMHSVLITFIHTKSFINNNTHFNTR